MAVNSAMASNDSTNDDENRFPSLEPAQVLRRFTLINRERLSRLRNSLPRKQQIFLDLLPLLFHAHHPQFPGYIEGEMPTGLSDYSPSKETLNAASLFSEEAAKSTQLLGELDIHALFLMGSSGTIAYSKKSDFDIWVCVRPGIADDELDLLSQKCDLIGKWATTLGLETYFYIMDAENFRNGEHQAKLSGNNSGNTQYYLLLEEFYRTSLLIAGRYPVWWLIPVPDEENYEQAVQSLVTKGTISNRDFIDFGSLPKVPADEFFAAAMWQLYKAVHSPYKSVLKILLMESYAHEYPQVNWLSHRLKQAVYSGETDIIRFDSYVLMYNKVEEYLQHLQQTQRLEIARRCFYLKVNLPLSAKSRAADTQERYSSLQNIVAEWDWKDEHIKRLDHRASWDIAEIVAEHNALVGELSTSYQLLTEFARVHSTETATDVADLKLLGRKLYAAFERKPGKIDVINNDDSIHFAQARLIMQRNVSAGQEGWDLYPGNPINQDLDDPFPIKQAGSFIELLTWCHYNKLLGPHTTIILQDPDNTLRHDELKLITRALEETFPDNYLQDCAMEVLRKPETITQCATFINVGHDPLSRFSRKGLELLSDRTDVLSYSGFGENLAQSFEIIFITSWQQILTHRFVGPTSLLDCICEYLAWFPVSDDNPPALPCFSFSCSRARSISQRVELLFQDIIRHFYATDANELTRFVIKLGSNFYVLQPENDTPRYHEFHNISALASNLGTAQDGFSPVVFDNGVQLEIPLHLIYRLNRPGLIQLFYSLGEKHMNLFIVDERGSLFMQTNLRQRPTTLLGQIQQFLNNANQHKAQLAGHNNAEELAQNIEFYQLMELKNGKYHVERQNPATHRNTSGYFSIKVTADTDEHNNTRFTVQCDKQAFSSAQYGDELFVEVAKHIVSKRQRQQTYPIYITDILLAPSFLGASMLDGLQTIHYLNYKRRIETRLNQALVAINSPAALA